MASDSAGIAACSSGESAALAGVVMGLTGHVGSQLGCRRNPSITSRACGGATRGSVFHENGVTETSHGSGSIVTVPPVGSVKSPSEVPSTYPPPDGASTVDVTVIGMPVMTMFIVLQ